MNIKIWLRTFYLLLLCSNLDAATFPLCDNLKRMYEINAPLSKVLVLTTAQGKKYILKQRNTSSARGQLMTVIEILGGHIAELARIQTNATKLIPAQDECKHLFFKGMPATLHTFMPGHTLDKAPAPYKKLALSQGCKNGKTCGLTLTLIKNMALHRDLPKIMALDTFIGNDSRYNGDLLYDDSKDQFFSIDSGDGLRTNLSNPSIRNVKKLIKNNVKLSTRQKNALATYLETLNHLIKHCKPQRITKKLIGLIETAGLKTTIKKDTRFRNEAKKLVFNWKHLIKSSYRDSQTLSALLYKLLSSAKK